MTTTLPPTPAAARPPSRTSALAVVIFLILVCSPCLGLAGGVAYLSSRSAGQFARWRSLATPPETAVSFVAADPFRVYVTSLSGQVYVCVHNQSAADKNCWRLADEPYTTANGTYFERLLQAGEIPPPPGPATDLAYASVVADEAPYEGYYALLSDGTVWVYQVGDGGDYSLVVLLGSPVLGLALGGVVILALLIIRATRRRRAGAASG